MLIIKGFKVMWVSNTTHDLYEKKTIKDLEDRIRWVSDSFASMISYNNDIKDLLDVMSLRGEENIIKALADKNIRLERDIEILEGIINKRMTVNADKPKQ